MEYRLVEVTLIITVLGLFGFSLIARALDKSGQGIEMSKSMNVVTSGWYNITLMACSLVLMAMSLYGIFYR